ncbi:ty3-gypsy retrotransposon protein [Cucumis melo var. makuwa]|uniref:Ty3-gypsy retrotransposon protein n=1 Tax=Cucumis melo var. makuwa TaxID=1194695 RepID=A0A5D3C2U5_CUCMM|nr:ty3-gypsy retrotransposon protein [Cucumis melo var. makuwa]
MTSQGNTSKALSDIGKRPNTRSRSREIQSSKDMPPFEVGIKPHTFEELATRAHYMELSIANRGNNDLLVPEIRKEKKEVKSTQKVLKGATKEAMVVSTTPLKLVSKEKKMKKRQDEGEKRRPTLNERQEKVYPFPDFDLPDMLDQLLEKQLIQLPECKRPAEMGRVNDPNYCKYHRVISHPVEKYFMLKELILKLALDKKIELQLDDVAQTNHAAVIIQPDSRLPAVGSLIQFGSLEPVVIHSSPEDLQNNDFRTDGPKEEKKQVDNVEEGWTLVTRRKKRKQSFSQKRIQLVSKIQEQGTTEDDAFSLNAMEETPKPEDLLPLGINDLLTLSQEVKDTIIEISKNDDVSTIVTSPTKTCDSCCMSISFSDEDLLLWSKLHNRPLYVSGYVREQKLNQILIDNGSAVNILPKSTMNQLGISVEELSNSKLVIQGFNQGAQLAIGTVRLEIVIGDLQASTIFHVIDSRTTYKMLLGHSWIHENGIVTSMLHQCFKFYKQRIRKVDADSRPFTKAESHFADANFYTKSEDGESPFAECSKNLTVKNTETLKENFTVLLTKIEKGEAKKIEKKGLEAYLPERRTVEGFDSKAYKLMAKAGYDFTTRTKLKSVKIFDEMPELFPTQKKLQKQGYSIPNSRAEIGYQSSKPVRITVNTEGSLKVKRHDVVFTRPEDNEPEDEVDVAGCCHVTIEKTFDHDIFEEDDEAAPLSLEDGGQSMIDELKEVNLGTK